MPEPIAPSLTEEEEEEEQESSGETPNPDEDKTKENKEKTSKPEKSVLVQKKIWRERAQKAEKDVDELRADLVELKALVAKPSSEQEQRAQEYIREQARRVFDELKAAEKRAEDEVISELETKVAAVLEENPDVSEEELMEVMEEEEVSPEVALKFLRYGVSKKDKKPKMPKPKQGSASLEDGKKPDDKGKSFWEIAKDEIDKFKNKE